ncbi:hypothetical protein HY095_06030 [Candidatus Micrarchaeota archaeon]|nr:hypothetical protein [Candidatus Micrarchaeota archaeon]
MKRLSERTGTFGIAAFAAVMLVAFASPVAATDFNIPTSHITISEADKVPGFSGDYNPTQGKAFLDALDTYSKIWSGPLELHLDAKSLLPINRDTVMQVYRFNDPADRAWQLQQAKKLGASYKLLTDQEARVNSYGYSVCADVLGADANNYQHLDKESCKYLYRTAVFYKMIEYAEGIRDAPEKAKQKQDAQLQNMERLWFSASGKVYQIRDNRRDIVNINVPCDLYPDSYVEGQKRTECRQLVNGKLMRQFVVVRNVILFAGKKGPEAECVRNALFHSGITAWTPKNEERVASAVFDAAVPYPAKDIGWVARNAPVDAQLKSLDDAVAALRAYVPPSDAGISASAASAFKSAVLRYVLKGEVAHPAYAKLQSCFP